MRLLDANTCIEHMRGRNPLVTARMAAADPARLFLCSVVLAELRYGAERSANPARENGKIDGLARRFASLPFDDAAAAEYVRLRLVLEAAGRMIAAIATAHNLAVVTHNTADFRRVPGLRVEDWQVP